MSGAPIALSQGSYATAAIRGRAIENHDSLGLLYQLRGAEPIKDWSLTSLKENLIKIGAKLVSHGRHVTFQMAEVAVTRIIFAEILRLDCGTAAVT